MNRSICLSEEASPDSCTFLGFSLNGIEIHFFLDGVQVFLLPFQFYFYTVNVNFNFSD
jgi:hypothetical protein